MAAVEDSRGLAVDKAALTGEQQRLVRRELRVRAAWDPVRSCGPPPAAFAVFVDDGPALRVPPHWARLRLPGVVPAQRFAVQAAPGLVFSGTLQEALGQPAAAAACMQAFRDTGGGVLSLYTGAGKTCVSLHVACSLKVKTLVVVNKAVLMDQWCERIAAFVPGCAVGRVRGPVCDVEGKDIVVGMLHSLSQREYGLAGFGLVVVDECVHLAARTFSQAMFQVNCPYRLGLSATPQRDDGLTKVIVWFLGPIFLTVERENQQCVTVRPLRFWCDDFAGPPPTRAGKVAFAKVLDVLAGAAGRSDEIAAAVNGLPPARRVLVLSDRREHCADLARRIGSHASLYLGGMRRADLEAAAGARVVVATFCLAAEGLDIPALDTLVLATPKKNVVQACGRIMRGAVTGEPLILDVQDAWPCLQGQTRARLEFYRASGFRVGGPPPATPAAPVCAFRRRQGP